jgi:hypothetical protein
MNLRWPGRTGGAVVIAALALSLLSTGAFAGSLITSRQIKNGTIRSIDIHNGTITGRDVRNGSIGYGDLSGAAVQRVQDGAVTAVSDKVEWSQSWQADGTNGATVDTATVLPQGMTVTLDHGYLTGDFGTCASSATVSLYLRPVAPGPPQGPIADWTMSPGSSVSDLGFTDDHTPVTVASDSVLEVRVQCMATSVTFGLVPSFSTRIGFTLPPATGVQRRLG